jgi:hypothetical protein
MVAMDDVLNIKDGGGQEQRHAYNTGRGVKQRQNSRDSWVAAVYLLYRQMVHRQHKGLRWPVDPSLAPIGHISDLHHQSGL